MCPNPNPCFVNVTLFESRVFAEVITLLTILRWDHPGLTSRILNPVACVPIRHKRRGQRPRGRRPCQDRNRDSSYADTSQGTVIITRNWKRQGRIDSPLEPFEWPYPHLDFALLAAATVREQMCIISSHSVCGNSFSSHRKRMQCLNENLSVPQKFLFLALAKGYWPLALLPNYTQGCYAWTEMNS